MPALPAQEELLNYCKRPKVAVFCTSRGLRALLSQIVGQTIFDKIEIASGADAKKELKPRFSVELALVNRAYLVRSVETSIQNSSDVSVAGASGVAPQKENPSGAGGETADPSEGTKVDNQPGPATTGASTLARKNGGSFVSVTTVLARPIVIGYRSVKWSFAQ